MAPDVNLKTYYLQYISNANIDTIAYKENLIQTVILKEKLHDYLKCYINLIKEVYNINMVNYNKEWINKEYNIDEALYNKVIKLINNAEEDDNRIVLIQLVKYCNILRVENKYNQLIDLAAIRKNITFSVYTRYVVNYYNKVHKTVLEGMGYRFSQGIGTYCINHWKLDKARMNKTKRIDFAATAAKKKELIAKGIKLYDDKEAVWYAHRRIPYNGVDFRVYKNESSFYEFTFIKSDIFTSSSLDYKRTEYVSAKYRGMSYTQMSDVLCNKTDDIYNLQVDIKYKLNILLHQNPNKYLNFIRNAEQCKYKRGAHNS